jgi:cyclopropane-fatty-acyl-phospholipid synthase
MAENGLLPDRLIRFGIRQLDTKRLHEEDHGDSEQPHPTRDQFITEMRQSPIAINTHKANEQHYELPAVFFEQVLGRHLKYSGKSRTIWDYGLPLWFAGAAVCLLFFCWPI